MRHFRVHLICILVSGELVKPVKREADYNICAWFNLLMIEGTKMTSKPPGKMVTKSFHRRLE